MRKYELRLSMRFLSWCLIWSLRLISTISVSFSSNTVTALLTIQSDPNPVSVTFICSLSNETSRSLNRKTGVKTSAPSGDFLVFSLAHSIRTRIEILCSDRFPWPSNTGSNMVALAAFSIRKPKSSTFRVNRLICR